jgi:hypothetical protein
MWGVLDMKKWIAILVGVFGTLSAAPNDQMMQGQPAMDCSSMSQEMQQFAGQLNGANKAMFCGKFNDMQRTQAMQMAAQVDPNGKPMMSGDQAVQKVASDSGLNPMKSPSGCPVK